MRWTPTQLPPHPLPSIHCLALTALERLMTGDCELAAIGENQIRTFAGNPGRVVAQHLVEVPFVDRHRHRVRQVGFLP